MIAWIKDHLVPEARAWWRLYSTWFIGAVIAIDALQLVPVMGMMPASVRAINPLVFDGLQGVLAAAALVLRFVRQPKVQAKVRPNADITTAG